MSYILDALKKAEAERHLGDVPSIHAAAPDAAAGLDEPPFWRKHLPWLITGFLVVLMLAYLSWSRPWSHVESAPVAAIAPPPAPIAAAPAPESAPVTPPAPVHETQAPAAPAEKPKTEKAASETKSPTLASSPTAKPEAPVAQSASSPSAAPSTSSTPATPSTPTTQDTQEDTVGTMQDLPAAIQRELPQVSVSGYIYARKPSERTALVNKKLLHEGETVAPDLVLERVTPKGAVLNYKGYRYRAY
jgi:general secretion pathway protein B